MQYTHNMNGSVQFEKLEYALSIWGNLGKCTKLVVPFITRISSGVGGVLWVPEYVNITIQGLWSPGVGIWFLMETQGWGNWHSKTWKCQIPLVLPAPPILGQTIDSCITRVPPILSLSIIYCFLLILILRTLGTMSLACRVRENKTNLKFFSSDSVSFVAKPKKRVKKFVN